MAVEAALFIPVLLLLIVGTVQFGKVTYTYFTLKKMVWAAGRQLAAQQGVNFCDPENDPKIAAAVDFALNDSSTGERIIPNVTGIQFAPQCATADGQLEACDTGSCESLGIGPRPKFLLVSITDGYPMTIRIPFINPVDVTLAPTALVPVGGPS
jgi:hypothetical protein